MSEIDGFSVGHAASGQGNLATGHDLLEDGDPGPPDSPDCPWSERPVSSGDRSIGTMGEFPIPDYSAVDTIDVFFTSRRKLAELWELGQEAGRIECTEPHPLP